MGMETIPIPPVDFEPNGTLETPWREVPGFFIDSRRMQSWTQAGKIIFPIAVLLSFLFLGSFLEAGEAEKTGDLLLTPHATLRSMDGEIHIRIGNPPMPLTLPAWRAAAGGVITSSTREKGCEYEFRFYQVEEVSNPVAKAGVIEVTAVNLTSGKVKSYLWVSWKTTPGDPTPSGLQGVLLSSKPPASGAILSSTPVWHPAATWYFLDAMFIRGRQIVYRVDHSPGWDRFSQVRQAELPYRDLTPDSLFGHTRLVRELQPEESASIRILVPFHPWPLEQRADIEALIHPGG